MSSALALTLGELTGSDAPSIIAQQCHPYEVTASTPILLVGTSCPNLPLPPWGIPKTDTNS